MKIFLLGYMIDSLMVSYMNSPSAKSIDDSTEVKFGKKSSAHVEGLREKFIRTKLLEWEDARQHVINMIVLTDELALQGRPIDDKTKIPTLNDSYLRSWLKWMQNWELTIFQLTLLNKRSLFLKEAKGLRRKENSKVTEVIEKITRGLKTKQIFCYHSKETIT